MSEDNNYPQHLTKTYQTTEGELSKDIVDIPLTYRASYKQNLPIEQNVPIVEEAQTNRQIYSCAIFWLIVLFALIFYIIIRLIL